MNKMLNSLYCLVSAVGAINWGLTIFLRFNLVEQIAKALKFIPFLGQALYAIVALAGIMVFVSFFMGEHQ